jgi:hypothetical protein
MNQLYQIGELVILQSEHQPKHNGEYIIEAIDDSLMVNVNTKKIEGGLGYYLGFTGDMGNKYWTQAALRKIHKPSTQSFTEMMSVLKMPNKVWERV